MWTLLLLWLRKTTIMEPQKQNIGNRITPLCSVGVETQYISILIGVLDLSSWRLHVWVFFIKDMLLQYSLLHSFARIPTPTAGPYAVDNRLNVLAKYVTVFSSASTTWTAIVNEVSYKGWYIPPENHLHQCKHIYADNLVHVVAFCFFRTFKKPLCF